MPIIYGIPKGGVIIFIIIVQLKYIAYFCFAF